MLVLEFVEIFYSIDQLFNPKSTEPLCTIQITDNTRTSLAQRISATNIVLPLTLPPGQSLYGDVDYIDMHFSTRSALSGTVSLKLGWSVTETTHTVLNTNSHFDPSRTSFKLWHHDQQIDPMDPDIASLLSGLSVVRPQPTNSIDGMKRASDAVANDVLGMFRLNEDLTAFCSREIIDQDVRLNALIDRDRNARCGVVAPSSREIAADAGDAGDLVVPNADRIIEDVDFMDPIDVQRHRGRKYLFNVYRTVGQHCDRLRKQSANLDLLIGNDVPTVATFFAGLRQLFRSVPGGRLEPARHLGADPSTSTAEPALLPSTVPFVQQQRQQQHQKQQQRLVVNILRAHGVPCRRQQLSSAATLQHRQLSAGGDASTSATTTTMTRKQSAVSSIMSQHQQQCATSLVRPYAVVSLRDRSVRTGTADGSGSNPTWNEQLMLTLHAGDHGRRDVLCVQIFDEVVEDLLDGEERTRSSEIYQRISGRWLGELRIPMFVVLSERRVSSL